MTSIPLWAAGPFELLVHGEEHYRNGDDFGRRMALISFDNALEVAISTYLSLHPIQRGNRSYSKEDCEQWLRDYHTKLEFLEAELQNRGLPWEISKAEIIWAHKHRGEQYHGGAKGTPEQNVIEIIRNAALWVFGILFEINGAIEHLESALEERKPAPLRERNEDYDKAIDREYGVIEVGPQSYYASELLFSVDYDAYVSIGQDLCSRTDESNDMKDQE